MTNELKPSAEELTKGGDELFHQQRYREAIETYSLALEHDSGWVRALSNRAVCHAMLGDSAAALEDFTTAIERDPRNPEWRRQRANYLYQITQFAAARREFDQLLEHQPNDVVALNKAGLLALRENDPALAARYIQRAISITPEDATTLINASAVYQARHDYTASSAVLQKLLARDPDNSEGLYNLGIAMSGLGRHAQAQGLFRRALEIQPAHVNARWNLALSLLRTGQWLEGWEYFEIRKQRTAALFKPPQHLRLTELEPRHLARGYGRVLVLAEQGLGDTLQFCRFLPALQELGFEVSLLAQAPLRPILARNFPSILVDESALESSQFDFTANLMSLPRLLQIDLLGLARFSTPYLQADRARVRDWSQRFSPREAPRLGLVWRGQPNPYLATRSIDLEALLAVLPPRSDVFSLQYSLLPEEVTSALGRVETYGGKAIDFEDTAAIIELMDLVITIDTSVAHLAAAMNKPTWVLLPHDADWRWMEGRPDSPWYTSAKLLRQESRGDWSGPLQTLGAMLLPDRP